MNTRYTAEVDQAGATVRQLNRAIAETVHTGEVTLTHAIPRGPRRRTLALFHQRLNAGHITWCDHARRNTTQTLYWSRWKPGRIYCGKCMIRTTLRLTTKQANTCCGCRKVRAGVTPDAIIIPALAVEDLDLVQGPIMIQHSLCPKCLKETEKGEEPEDDDQDQEDQEEADQEEEGPAPGPASIDG